MKLWMLKPIAPNSPPWDPWYDKTFGFVIRAENEIDARNLATSERNDEPEDAWMNPALSSCVELTTDGDCEVVLQDFRQG